MISTRERCRRNYAVIPVVVLVLASGCDRDELAQNEGPNGAVGSAGQTEPSAGSGGSLVVSSGGASGTGGTLGNAGTNHSAGGSAGSGGNKQVDCSPESVRGITLPSSSRDPLGYAPYALDGCRLVYVAALGELRLKDLATGAESVIADAAEEPRRPALAGSLLAWEATTSGKSQVRLKLGSSTPITITGNFDHAGEPRVTADALVFTGFISAEDAGDTDVYLYDPENDKLIEVSVGKGQQRFADVSMTHVAFTDFSEDPSGIFRMEGSNADIVVFDRETRQKVVRALPGKQAFPMLGQSEVLAYLDWRSVHPEPKFSAFTLRRGQLTGDPQLDVNVKPSGEVHTNPAYVRPAVHGIYVDFIDDSSGTPELYRARLDKSDPPTPVLQQPSLLGPVLSANMTILARDLGTRLELVAVAR